MNESQAYLLISAIFWIASAIFGMDNNILGFILMSILALAYWIKS